jgi:hypothetical protein
MLMRSIAILALSLMFVLGACTAPATIPETITPSTPNQQAPASAAAPVDKPLVKGDNLLINPGFELGSQDQPDGWSSTGWKPGIFLWDSTVAHSGKYSVKIEAQQANDLRWIQRVAVLPNSQYQFTAWVLTADVGHSQEANDVGANLSIDGTYSWSEDLKGNNDWTPLSLNIMTGPADSALTVELRLGFYSGTNTGTVWFDDAALQRIENGDYVVYEGQHVALQLFRSDADMISNLQEWLQQLDMAYELLEGLVGSSPYNGEKITIREVPPMKYGGLAGNPILMNQQTLQIERLNNPNDLDFGVIHELAHDFDISPYSTLYIGDGAINAEGWSNLKLVYVADKMSNLYPEATFGAYDNIYRIGETGSIFRKKHAEPYLQSGRRDGLQMNNDVFTGLLYSLIQQIGWEPFKATFRDYQTYSQDNSAISSSVEKIRLFVKLLSKNSGKDLAPTFQSWGFDV